MNNIKRTLMRARRYLSLGNELAYEDEMIQSIKESSSEDAEYLIKAGKRDGYSFRQFGLKVKV